MSAINDKELIKKLQNNVDDFKLKFRYLKELIDDYSGEDSHRFIPETVLPILANPDITSDEIKDKIEQFNTIDNLMDEYDDIRGNIVKIARTLESNTNVPSGHDEEIIDEINSLLKKKDFYGNVHVYCNRILEVYKNRK